MHTEILIVHVNSMHSTHTFCIDTHTYMYYSSSSTKRSIGTVSVMCTHCRTRMLDRAFVRHVCKPVTSTSPT